MDQWHDLWVRQQQDDSIERIHVYPMELMAADGLYRVPVGLHWYPNDNEKTIELNRNYNLALSQCKQISNEVDKHNAQRFMERKAITDSLYDSNTSYDSLGAAYKTIHDNQAEKGMARMAIIASASDADTLQQATSNLEISAVFNPLENNNCLGESVSTDPMTRITLPAGQITTANAIATKAATPQINELREGHAKLRNRLKMNGTILVRVEGLPRAALFEVSPYGIEPRFNVPQLDSESLADRQLLARFLEIKQIAVSHAIMDHNIDECSSKDQTTIRDQSEEKARTDPEKYAERNRLINKAKSESDMHLREAELSRFKTWSMRGMSLPEMMNQPEWQMLPDDTRLMFTRCPHMLQTIFDRYAERVQEHEMIDDFGKEYYTHRLAMECGWEPDNTAIHPETKEMLGTIPKSVLIANPVYKGKPQMTAGAFVQIFREVADRHKETVRLLDPDAQTATDVQNTTSKAADIPPLRISGTHWSAHESNPTSTAQSSGQTAYSDEEPDTARTGASASSAGKGKARGRGRELDAATRQDKRND